jgi:hypothetical protein
LFFEGKEKARLVGKNFCEVQHKNTHTNPIAHALIVISPMAGHRRGQLPCLLLSRSAIGAVG